MEKEKIINYSEILIKDLPDLSTMNKDEFLFTPSKFGGEWIATENNRRDYFSKRFKTKRIMIFCYSNNNW